MIVNGSTILRLGGVRIKKLYKGGVLIYNIVAKLLYAAPFTYTLDANGNNIIENQGSGADGLLYTGQGLEVLSTQVFPIPIETSGHCVAMYDVINTQWVYVTATTAPSYTIPAGTYGHIAVLATEPSVADKAYADINIDAYKDLWFGRATGLTSIVKADIQHLYIPNVLQGAGIQDLSVALGTELTNNRTFDSGIIEWSVVKNAGTYDWDSASQSAHVVNVGGYTFIINTVKNYTTGIFYKITFDLNLVSGTFVVQPDVSNGVNDFLFSTSGKKTVYVKLTTPYIYFGSSVAYSCNAYIDNISIVECAYIALPNYDITMYLNANQDANAQQTASTLFDSTGRAIGVDYDNLNFYSLGYLDTQTNLSTIGNFWIDEIIGTTIYQHHYDGVNLTTYTNNVAGTPTAHTPENANYLLGKGVYPKVTADTYATYKHGHFQVEADTLYLGYNQATRYTELGGI